MTSNSISVELRRLVTQRAATRCEYCQIHQNFSIYTHEVDHIIAVKHGVKLLLIIWHFHVYLVTVTKALISLR
ncbi:HNH endonuclease [Nostoc sp.]|uniref:HNH endonuclease n=1 Tax=Nostoc sp. TaxID=1180 RepID=UPI002FF5C233